MNTPMHRSGYVAIVGRPNVGKSTLLNHILGQKLSIVSRRPQTTRNRVLGIYNRDDAQALFLDTPGIHNARGALNKRMVAEATSALSEVDVVLLLIDPAREADASEDAEILEMIARESGKPVVIVPNKIDRVPKETLLPLIDSWSQAGSFAGIVPISALHGDGVAELLRVVVGLLGEGPAFFPKDQLTDVTERFVVSEMIREKLFYFLNKELPYSVAVEIEEWVEKKGGALVRIMARIWVDRDSQKGIVIGKGGNMLKRIGTSARLDIERLLDCKVFLQLTVGVEENWTRRQRKVEKLGQFEGER